MYSRIAAYSSAGKSRAAGRVDNGVEVPAGESRGGLGHLLGDADQLDVVADPERLDDLEESLAEAA